jgi:orotate phosphoribosyltransferase
MENEEVAEILLDVGAVSLNAVNPFKYASGMLSPIYTNCRVLTSYPNERKVIVDLLKSTIERSIGREFDIVVGTASSGISLATYLASYFGLPMAYVRAAAKEHGKGKQIEGAIKEGMRAVLVSDIMSTEQDVPNAVKALKDAGVKVVYCITIFSNNLGAIEKSLEADDIPHSSLTDLKTLLVVASVKKRISRQDRDKVLEWMEDPEHWDAARRQKIEKMTVENKEKVAEVLLKIKAVTLNTKQPYRYKSGILSPIYTDNRLLMSHPKDWQKVMDAFINVIVDKIGLQNVDVIAGTATAGISHAAYLSERLHLPMVYVKSSTDEAGNTTYKVEGRVKKGDRVLVLEDLISTGGSSLSTVKAVREAGGTVDNCIAIFTYGMDKAKKAYDDEHVNILTLTDISTLIEVASRQDYIKPGEKQLVMEWTKDTSGWGKKHGFE